MEKGSRYNVEIKSFEDVSSRVDVVKKAALHGFALESTAFTENTITISIPPKTMAEGHIINMQMQIANSQDHFSIKVTGKIIEYLEINKDCSQVTVEFKQIDKDLWGRLLNQMAQDQNHVEDIFHAIKGDR